MASLPSSDIAFRLLRLEQQLDAYERLHAEELKEIRRTLAELKLQLVTLGSPTGAVSEVKDETDPE